VPSSGTIHFHPDHAIGKDAAEEIAIRAVSEFMEPQLEIPMLLFGISVF
jgi:hypothetical protein